MHFDLIDMRLFVNIAKTSSLTRGAQLSYMSLPAASTRIKNIEDRLGTKLLYRHSQGITITPAGHTFLHHAVLVMQHIENLMGEMQDHARGVKGHVRIYANTNSIEFLPGVLASYLASHPFVSIDLREQLSRDVVQAVTEGSTDIGIVAGNIYTGTLQVLPYKHDRLVLTTAINHPLAERGTIPFSESLSWDYVGLLEGSAMHVYISAAAKELNIPLKVRIQVGNFEALCRMVEENVGVGIVPESVARRHEKNMRIRIVDLSDDWAVRNLKVCVRDLQMLPSFARELVDLLVADADAEIEVGLAISK